MNPFGFSVLFNLTNYLILLVLLNVFNLFQKYYDFHLQDNRKIMNILRFDFILNNFFRIVAHIYLIFLIL